MDSPSQEKFISKEHRNVLLRQVPEDCVEYCLYVVDSKPKTRDQVRNLCEAILSKSIEITKKLLEGYIWNREDFKLEIRTEDERIYLYGLTNYGDSLEDEWLIVYILKQLSSHFHELWIQIVDTDGEFLLIEAANALPRWLNPEIADNRVWIHNNKLYLIPLHATCCSSNTPSKFPISRPLGHLESLQIIEKNAGALICPPLIEKEAFYRLRDYPSQISASLHFALVQIPRKLAYILLNLPASISPSVEALYLRDPVSMKYLNTDQSNLLFPPEDLVKISTKFTKLRFAQVKSQELSTPLNWKKKLETTKKCDNISYEQLKLGMKLACGFEMLMKDPQYNNNVFVEKINFLLKEIADDENSAFPSDTEILCWNEKFREDDENWMNIDFRDFEQELDGRSGDKNVGSGFGDAKTQGDLRKMVERFKSFLDDEKAGPDGVELDDTDIDNDQDSSENDSSDEDPTKDVSFDSKEFSRMIQEMIENPSEIDRDYSQSAIHDANVMKEAIEQMEKELKEAGALGLDSEFYKSLLSEKQEEDENGDQKDNDSVESDDTDEKFDIDFNLAKNLMESIKSQEGLPSPAGNLMGIMGLQIPKNEINTKLPKS
ncbi:Protein ecdysoneless-like protein [Erysiphe neolycopersici]|uniref:Protein ecdysoneless-like protein n=1 Tax=Erysiphe neolycopersici TaxID=212602 RepID=A0A420HLI8_9PEZI|nr:Protein ecdysoneless-like protein [Erysiphe neolycopersici]